MRTLVQPRLTGEQEFSGAYIYMCMYVRSSQLEARGLSTLYTYDVFLCTYQQVLIAPWYRCGAGLTATGIGLLV